MNDKAGGSLQNKTYNSWEGGYNSLYAGGGGYNSLYGVRGDVSYSQ